METSKTPRMESRSKRVGSVTPTTVSWGTGITRPEASVTRRWNSSVPSSPRCPRTRSRLGWGIRSGLRDAARRADGHCLARSRAGSDRPRPARRQPTRTSRSRGVEGRCVMPSGVDERPSDVASRLNRHHARKRALHRGCVEDRLGRSWLPPRAARDQKGKSDGDQPPALAQPRLQGISVGRCFEGRRPFGE